MKTILAVIRSALILATLLDRCYEYDNERRKFPRCNYPAYIEEGHTFRRRRRHNRKLSGKRVLLHQTQKALRLCRTIIMADAGPLEPSSFTLPNPDSEWHSYWLGGREDPNLTVLAEAATKRTLRCWTCGCAARRVRHFGWDPGEGGAGFWDKPSAPPVRSFRHDVFSGMIDPAPGSLSTLRCLYHTLMGGSV